MNVSEKIKVGSQINKNISYVQLKLISKKHWLRVPASDIRDGNYFSILDRILLLIWLEAIVTKPCLSRYTTDWPIIYENKISK